MVHEVCLVSDLCENALRQRGFPPSAFERLSDSSLTDPLQPSLLAKLFRQYTGLRILMLEVQVCLLTILLWAPPTGTLDSFHHCECPNPEPNPVPYHMYRRAGPAAAAGGGAGAAGEPGGRHRGARPAGGGGLQPRGLPGPAPAGRSQPVWAGLRSRYNCLLGFPDPEVDPVPDCQAGFVRKVSSIQQHQLTHGSRHAATTARQPLPRSTARVTGEPTVLPSA